MKKPFEEKLADLIRRMNSPHEGEVIASALALRRTLVAAGRDFHEIAELVEHGSNGKLSEAEMKKIWDDGFKTGLETGENRNVQTFHNTSDDYSMVQFCWERAERLPKRYADFVESMVELAGEGELTPKQHAYLKSLYRQLGGR